MLIYILPVPVLISNTADLPSSLPQICFLSYFLSSIYPSHPENPTGLPSVCRQQISKFCSIPPSQLVFLFLILANIPFQWLSWHFLKSPAFRFHHSNLTCRLLQRSAIQYTKDWSVASDEGLQFMSTIQGCTERKTFACGHFFCKSATSSCPRTYTCFSQSLSWKALSAVGHVSLPAVLQNRKILTQRGLNLISQFLRPNCRIRTLRSPMSIWRSQI